jgi:hypothetical protein
MDGQTYVSSFLTRLHLFNIFWTYKHPTMKDLWHLHERLIELCWCWWCHEHVVSEWVSEWVSASILWTHSQDTHNLTHIKFSQHRYFLFCDLYCLSNMETLMPFFPNSSCQIWFCTYKGNIYIYIYTYKGYIYIYIYISLVGEDKFRIVGLQARNKLQ